MLLIGDGSGREWGLPVGWACVAIEPNKMERRVFTGGMNDGTVNMAELMAYVAPLTFYARQFHEADKKAGKFRPHDVHLLTDSQYVQTGGAELGKRPVRPVNVVMWHALAAYNRLGMRLHWHWLPRESAALNAFADVASKAARAAAASIKLPAGVGPQDFNPWE